MGISGLIRALRALAGDRRGNIAINLALALPLLLAAFGAAFDVASFASKRAALQAASDAAAEAGAQQLAVASTQTSTVVSIAQAFLSHQLTGDEATATNVVSVDPAAGTVTVQLTEYWNPVLAHYLNASITPIITTSVAQLQGETRLCILTLDPGEAQAYRMLNSAAVKAPSCGVYSNSTDKAGMFLGNASSITAAVICSAGGVKSVSSQTNVQPQTDCPVYPDPLAAHAVPSVGSCNYNNYSIISGAAVLSPGTYCGGLKISGTASVTFQPGTYVINGGAFQISSSASA